MLSSRFHENVQIDIDDNTKLSASDYRDRLYKEIYDDKKEARRRRKDTISKRGSLSRVLAPADENLSE